MSYPVLAGGVVHGQHLYHRDAMWRYRPHRLKGLFPPYAVNIHRCTVISIDDKPTVWAFVDGSVQNLLYDYLRLCTKLELRKRNRAMDLYESAQDCLSDPGDAFQTLLANND